MDKAFLLFVIVGFVAQMVDGALGMCYGVISTIFLLNFGIPPAVASAGVHAAKILTGGVSGLSHLGFGNVDRELFKKLLIPGSLGGLVGAYLITVLPEQIIKPFVSFYLAILLAVLGVVTFYKAFKKIQAQVVTTKIIPLAFVGGFLDSAGGGWGPIVTSALVARGSNPRMTIGSANLAKFFVSMVQLATILTFSQAAGLRQIGGLVVIIAGLIFGGVLAAPLAAYTCKKIPAHALLLLVGVLIIALSARTIYLAL